MKTIRIIVLLSFIGLTSISKAQICGNMKTLTDFLEFPLVENQKKILDGGFTLREFNKDYYRYGIDKKDPYLYMLVYYLDNTVSYSTTNPQCFLDLKNKFLGNNYKYIQTFSAVSGSTTSEKEVYSNGVYNIFIYTDRPDSAEIWYCVTIHKS